MSETIHMRWRLENTVPERMAVAWFSLRDVTVKESSPGLDDVIGRRAAELRSRYPEPAAAAEILEASRRLYRGLGIDPSRRRPSSEALVRRVLQGKGLYRVNTAVDAANLTSMIHYRSVGLYDCDAIRPLGEPAEPRVLVRLGAPAEEYPGIRKDSIHVAGRPVLSDAHGPFGNPSADSDRTKVTLATRRLLYVLFELPEEAADLMTGRLNSALAVLREHLGGEIETPPTL